MPEFRRDRMTWVAYAMLAWFAYLQASPGLVVPHLRDELHMSYSSGGLHVAAFAGGSWSRASRRPAPSAPSDARRCSARDARDGRRDDRAHRRAQRGRDAHRHAGDGHRRRPAADHDPGTAGRPPRAAAHDRADRGERRRERRLCPPDRRARARRGNAGRLARRPPRRARAPAGRVRPLPQGVPARTPAAAEGSWRAPARVLGRRRDALLHDRRRVVRHRLGGELSRTPRTSPPTPR